MLVKLGPNNHRVLVLAHHLVIDGISSRIIVEDLIKLYNNSGALPQKTNSFPQWATKVLQYSESLELQKQEEYWKAVASNGMYK